MKKSPSDQPFTEEEKKEIQRNFRRSNDLLEALNGFKVSEKEDFYLTFNKNGRRLTFKNIAYTGKGVKSIQLNLTPEGKEIVEKYLEEWNEAV
jgi:hypothetical protein